MLGHELTHIRNGDVRMLVIAVVIAGVISFFGEMVFRLFFQSMLLAAAAGARAASDRKGGAGIAIVIALALIAVAWVLSIVIRFALSRQREYLADAGSVELTKNPDAMISALRKIEGRGEMPGATSAVMEMCIDNPREGFSNIFDTHPSVDKRVEALVKFAGGHDPGPLALAPPEEREPPKRRETDPPADGPWRAGRRRPRRATTSGPWGPEPGASPPRSAGRPMGPRDARLMPLERDQRAHRHVELAQLVGAAELRQVDDEAGGEHVGAELAQQLDRRLPRCRRWRSGRRPGSRARPSTTASSCISISSRPYSSE